MIKVSKLGKRKYSDLETTQNALSLYSVKTIRFSNILSLDQEKKNQKILNP